MTNRKKCMAMEGNINIEHIIILSDFVLQKYYFRGILWIQRPHIFQLLYHIETDPSCQEPLYPINLTQTGVSRGYYNYFLLKYRLRHALELGHRYSSEKYSLNMFLNNLCMSIHSHRNYCKNHSLKIWFFHAVLLVRFHDLTGHLRDWMLTVAYPTF